MRSIVPNKLFQVYQRLAADFFGTFIKLTVVTEGCGPWNVYVNFASRALVELGISQTKFKGTKSGQNLWVMIL